MKTAIQILGVITLAMALGACSKKSSKSSTVATTPTTQCVYNGYGGYVYTGTSTPCTPTTGTGTCVQSSNGQYLNQYGQTCYPGQTGTQFPGGGDGCSQYYYQYGVQYVPVNMNGQLMCMRYDLVQQYYGGQYYGQPIYGGYYGGQYGYGGYGNTSCINIGGQSWGSSYGINGSIGLCF